MKKHRKGRKPTLKDLVAAAHKAGVQVDVGLQPKETCVAPLHRMAEDLQAIAHLAETRNVFAIKSAHALLNRISRNDCLFILSQLEKEYWDKPVLKRP